MFDVSLLIERQLNELDADQIIALHEGLDDTVRYHLLLPVESSPALLMSSMGALGGQVVTLTDPGTIDDVQERLEEAGQSELDASAALLTLAARYDLGGSWSIAAETRATIAQNQRSISGNATLGWRF